MENAIVYAIFSLSSQLNAFQFKFTYMGVPKSSLQGAMSRSS
jgi:hypothetical protein